MERRVDESQKNQFSVHGQISSSSDLNCDFNTLCRWRNSTTGGEDDGDFLLTDDIRIDQFHHIRPIKNVTGNRFVFTHGPFDGYQRAILISDVVSCQLGGGILRFWYYRTGNMATLDVCIRQPPGGTDVAGLKCFPAFAGNHGQQWVFNVIEFPPVTQPFELLLRASYVQPLHIIAIDDITFESSLCGFSDEQRSLEVLKMYHPSMPESNAIGDCIDCLPTAVRFKRAVDSSQSPQVIGYHEWELMKKSYTQSDQPAMLVVAEHALLTVPTHTTTTASSANSHRAPSLMAHDQNNYSISIASQPSESKRTTLPTPSRRALTTQPPSTTATMLANLSPIVPYMVVDPLSTSIATQRPTSANIVDDILTARTPQHGGLGTNITDAVSARLPKITEFLKQLAAVMPILSSILSAMQTKEVTNIRTASAVPFDTVVRSADTHSLATPINFAEAASSQLSVFTSSSAMQDNASDSSFNGSPTAVPANNTVTSILRSALDTQMSSTMLAAWERMVPFEKINASSLRAHGSLNIKKIPKNNFGMQRTLRRIHHSSSTTSIRTAFDDRTTISTTKRLKEVKLKAHQKGVDKETASGRAKSNGKKAGTMLTAVMQRHNFSSNQPAMRYRDNEVRQLHRKATVSEGRTEEVPQKWNSASDGLLPNISNKIRHETGTSTAPLTIFEKNRIYHSENLPRNLPREVLDEISMLKQIPNLPELIDGMDLNLLNQPGGFALLKEQFIERFLRQQNSKASLSRERKQHHRTIALPHFPASDRLLETNFGGHML
ncbi:hypothetical protein Tcan_05577 [Toxocara canis]|uniref:MAM domain-containing protein n=1 Tax=Toxocara canis TaxID=6265 RepID=A0A0B2VXJ9_TOXCA|nr:hypothetical protein Tcan_05577 [Toxocara canis]